jgi:hydrogenase maturation protein HypF
MTARAAFRIVIQGVVQGQGIRPALARMAEERGWCGTVCNSAEGVELYGAAPLLDEADFEAAVRATVRGLTALRIERVPDAGWTSFSIEPSSADADLATPVPPDVALCVTCQGETETPANRRDRYGLTSCATCGPRFSLIKAMPFDRVRTTLQAFPLCEACQREYHDVSDRRRHAQTMACPACGPQVWASDASGRTLATGDDAVVLAARALLDGKVLALRGVGGYQLLVDATNEQAVDALRRRKVRPSKPFAILCHSIESVRTLAELDSVSERELLSQANPIVLVPRRPGAVLAANATPHLHDIGVLLPTTAIQARLAALTGKPLVCTSGNRDGEPLAYHVKESLRTLGDVADVFLHHDREIVHPIDDSVVRPMAGVAVTLRCGRGLAPLPLPLVGTPTLALGAQLKSALAWSNGRQSALGPHVGDLQDLATRGRWSDHITAMTSLYGLRGAPLVADAHPDGFPMQWAEATGHRLTPVWHHHAHVVAAMVEHGWLDRTVLGIAADGTGLGPDGTIWGGEILLATGTGFERVAHLRTFELPGGEAAIHEIWRAAVSVASHLDEYSIATLSRVTGVPDTRIQGVLQACRSGLSSVTSSLGRLFDVAACLILGLNHASHEGEAAMRIEAACDPSAEGEYRWKVVPGDLIELDWRPAIQSMLADRVHGVAPGVMAERFHRSVAAAMIDAVRALVQRHVTPASTPVVLSGGVFQNRRLVELLVEGWPSECGPLGLPGRIPPNDGGLAVGQLAIALARQVAHPSQR